MPRLVLLVLLSALFSLQLSAQTDSSESKLLSGVILDDSLGHVIPFAHLWNERTRMGGISDDSGIFHISIRKLDTIYFSALGYQNKKIVIPDSSGDLLLEIRLQPKKYEINEVVVRRFGTYESFKQQVLNYRVPETETTRLRAHLAVAATNAAIESDQERINRQKMSTGGFGVTSSMGAGINREKQRMEHLARLKKRTQIINQKFNREMVGEITKLEGEALTHFMAFCNFSEEYLYKADLYSIIETIHKKYSAYLPVADTVPQVN